MKLLIRCALSGALLSSLPLVAQAQNATDSVATSAPLTGNLTLTSQYISRGFRQTWGKPALQGGLDYADPSGFSVGTWLSTVSNRYIEDGTLEWDIYGNYGASLGPLGYSAGLYVYKYPGAEYRAAHLTYDYVEVALGLSYQVAYLKYNYTVSKEFFGIANARGTGYLDVGANPDLGDGYTLNLHYGQGRVANNSLWSWRDYKIGVSKLLAAGWILSGAYTRAHGKTNVYDTYTLGIPNSAGHIDVSNPAAGTLVLALTRTF